MCYHISDETYRRKYICRKCFFSTNAHRASSKITSRRGIFSKGSCAFFSVFADYTRVKILSALAISELCVTDISRILDLNQTTVSHQLRFLKSAGIVKCCRQGKVIFYSLTNDSINDVLLKGIEFLGC